MTQFVIANDVNTTLAAPITSAATSLTLASSANLPTLSNGQVMPLVLNDAATGQSYEVVYVTAISGVSLTVERAQEGTGALNWNVGDYAYCGPTSGSVATAFGNPANLFQVANPATGDSSNNAAPTSFVQGFAGGRKAIYTSSGSWTSPITGTIWLSGCAAGGGGGGGAGNAGTANSAGGGGGGGAGQSIIRNAFSVTAGQVINITIGGAGSGGPGGAAGQNSGTAGSAGGDTVIGALITLKGGTGGGQGGGSPASGGGGGQGYPSGSSGMDGAAFSAGGAGASGVFGGGGGAPPGASGRSFGGFPAGGYGAGGAGGSACYGATSAAGGSGGAGGYGFAMIEW